MSRSLDSRQLQAFVAVARRQSFTLAAKDLHLTQSAVSHALRALEGDLGCRLLDRMGRRVALTHHGEQFLRRAEAVLRDMERARTELEDLTNWGHGRLRVGASTTVCQHLLPTVLREFKQSFPRCVLRIEPGDLPWQVELLQRGTIDLTVSLEPVGDDEMKFLPLFEDELRLMVGPMHPWAQAGRATREQLAEETVMLYNRTSSTYAMVQDYFAREGVTLGNCIQLGSMEAIKELAKVGLGAGVLAPWVVREDLAAGRLVSLPLGRRPLKRRWGITHLAQRQLSLGEETFVGLCQAVVDTMELAAAKAGA
ncbi:MAG TPA: LysR family transcriptional regulator [Opitutaceae bacterium]|nr:LysR family transcriptional regulator [Opitutaceae bacterium]